MLRSIRIAVLCAVAGCPASAPTVPRVPPVSSGTVRVRTFTEPAPVRMVVAAEKLVFVATGAELERFDDVDGVFALSAAAPIAADGPVLALAADGDRRTVWVLTEHGLGRYDITTAAYRHVATPPAEVDLAQLARDGEVSIAALDGNVWIGSGRGIARVDPNGTWTETELEPVRALLRDRSGYLWIATASGLLVREPNGMTTSVGPGHGNTVTKPRMLVEMPGDRVMAIGGDDQGRERIAIGDAVAWTTYRALPDVTWEAATKRAAGAFVMGNGRVYRIGPVDPGRVRPLARAGMRLVAVTGATAAAEWAIDRIDLVVPPGATSLGGVEDQLLIGTRDLGTARFHISGDGRAQAREWLRGRQMFEDATSLSVACQRVDDCWIATGARRAWRWTGDQFVEGGPDATVLAVVRSGSDTFALHRDAPASEIKLSKIDRHGGWTEVPRIAVSTPGGAPEVTFATVARGAIWIGLRSRDDADGPTTGAARIDLARETARIYGAGSRGAGAWPVPTDAVDAALRGDVAYFATTSGAVRVAGGKVERWTSADGLRTDDVRALAWAPDGRVIAATSQGASVWDGKTWRSPGALEFEIHDVVATRNGQLWMATPRGIAVWDGATVRRVDMRRGLVENEILDIATDQFDRVWARGAGSLTLISQ